MKVSILIDSSSLMLTYSAGLLSDVIRWYEVLIPTSVYEEITVPDKPGAEYFQDLKKEGNLQILNSPAGLHLVKEEYKAELLKMGQGERDIMIHVLTGRGSFAVVDDLLAARFCVKCDIPFINALLLPKILHLAGVISLDEFRSSLSNLENRGRYSNGILARAKSFTAIDLEQFFPPKNI